MFFPTQIRTAILILLVLFVGPTLEAQVAQTGISAVSPPGAQRGQAIDVTISSGKDLDMVDKLVFSHAGITAKQKMSDQAGKQVPVTNTFEVTVAADVPIGFHDVRAHGYFGISNPRTFVISDSPEVLENDANNTLDTAQPVDLGTIVNGASNRAADIDFYKITLPANHHLLVEAEAQTIDSRMRGQIELLNASGRRLERSRGGYRGDPVLDYTVKVAGEYYLKVTEFSYRGSNDYFYRLQVNSRPHIDFMMPASGQPGSNSPYTIYGRNLPGGAPSGVKVDGVELQKITTNIALPANPDQLILNHNLLPAESSADVFGWRLQTPQGTSNSLSIHYADAPVILEQEPNNEAAKAQQITVPTEITGQFQEKLDTDWYQFTAKAGEAYAIETYGQRLGKETDPRFIVEQVTVNDKGEESVKRLTDQDDVKTTIGGDDFNTRHRDPVWMLAVPADGAYRVMIGDRYRENRGDAQLLYRLVIRKQTPDFRLIAFASTPNAAANQPGTTGVLSLRKGDNSYIDVLAHRIDGFNGAIDVKVENLPAGVTCPGAVIGPGANSARLILTAAPDAGVNATAIKVTGDSRIEVPQVQTELKAAVAAIKPAEDKIPALDKVIADVMPKIQVAQKKLDADKLTAEAQVKTALTNLTNAQKAQQTAQAVVTEQQKKVQAAETVLNTRNAELKTAQDALTKAKTDAAADAENQDKANAVKTVEQQVQVATKNQQDATNAVNAEKQKLAQLDTDLKAKTAVTVKTTADKKTADDNLKSKVTLAEAELKKVQDQLKAAQDNLTVGQKAVADAKQKVNTLQQQLQQTAIPTTHIARTASLIWTGNQNTGENTDARLTRSIMVSVMDDLAEFQAVVTAPSNRFEVSQSSQVLIPVKVERREGFDANVTLTFAGFDARTSKLQVENTPLKKGETEGVRRIFIPKDSPPGAYTLYLNSQAQVSYTRNPVAIAAAQATVDTAEADRKAKEEANKQAIAAQQKADADLKAAEQKLKTATDALTNAQTAQQASQKVVTDQQAVVQTAEATLKTRDAELKNAQDALAKAKTDLDADKENQEKATAVTTTDQLLQTAMKAQADATNVANAEKQKLTQAEADLKVKTEAVTKADAEKKTTEAALAISKDVKTKADASAKTADAAFKASTTVKTNADKNLQTVTNANKAKNVNLTVPSTPVVLVVSEAPYEVVIAAPDSGNLKKGASIDVKVTVKRIPRFDGPVTVSLPLPPGVTGLKADPLTIPPDQTEGILKIHADGTAPDGKPANLVIRGKADFLGKASVDAPLSLNLTK
ncbi:MAG: hypothetical protein P8M30_10125 [Planctomycetaceae bacterium]|nr:hypothetical protein [Planctomycetaceae bacterium]MDG2389662.1 hypothetical protein [Planctomycetaceae bacterium]